MSDLLFFILSKDGKQLGIRTSDGDWLLPCPTNDPYVVSVSSGDGQVAMPYPRVRRVESATYRMANPLPPVADLSEQAALWEGRTGYDVFAAKVAAKYRHSQIHFQPLRAALAFALISVRRESPQAMRLLALASPLLRTDADYTKEQVEAFARQVGGLQNQLAGYLLSAQSWCHAFTESRVCCTLYDTALLRYLAREGGLPNGALLAKTCFTLSLLGSDLPCIDGRILKCAYTTRRDEAEAYIQHIGKKGTKRGVFGGKLLVDTDGVDAYMDAATLIFTSFGLMQPTDAMFYTRSQWALWERCGDVPQLETHAEFYELLGENE
jgi:hypothetical protein